MSPTARFQLIAPARKAALAGAACAAFAALPSHATVVIEAGDAGESLATAQITAGAPGALTSIVGSLLSSTDADLYVIDITAPAAFSATTVNAVGGYLDTQLFLFTMAGAPVYLNDDDAGGLTTLSTLPAGSSFGPTVAGLYVLGVSLSGYDPANINAQLLFAAGLPTTVRGPASGLQPAMLGAFADNTYSSDSGAYDIQLTGAMTAAVPEPASALLLLAGGAVCAGAALRRRRSAVAAHRRAA